LTIETTHYPRGPLGWAILGCGRVADKRIAPAINAVAEARLAAVCSRSADKARDFAAQHNAARAHYSIDALLADPSVQIVYIATPNDRHLADTLRCLEAGKHVMVDKPIALSSADARTMIDTARRLNLRLGVMHQQRFHPANLDAIRLIRDGTLGRLLMVRAQVGMWYPPTGNWRLDRATSGGGVLMDLGPHLLDIVSEIGGPVAQVKAECRNLAFTYGVEDFCCARLAFANGAVGLCDMAYCYHDYGGRLEVFGEKGSFVVRGSLQQARQYQSWLRIGEQTDPPNEGAYPDCFIDAIRDFSTAVITGRPAAISTAGVLHAMEVIESIYKSGTECHSVPVAHGAHKRA